MSDDINLDASEFDALISDRIALRLDILGRKRQTYAGPFDPLHNFRVTAATRNTTLQGAVSGMMVKHTVRLYDMLEAKEMLDYSIDEWREVIGDHLNYLLILSAIIESKYFFPVSEGAVSAKSNIDGAIQNTLRATR